MNKILITLLVLLAMCGAGLAGYMDGVSTGESAGKIAADKAYKRLDEANALLQTNITSIASAHESISKLTNWYNDCVGLLNGMADLVWDIPADKLKEVIKDIPKPQPMITLDVPSPIKYEINNAYPSPLF